MNQNTLFDYDDEYFDPDEYYLESTQEEDDWARRVDNLMQYLYCAN